MITASSRRIGYIFVFQDIRGRYGSEGEFIMQRPLRDTADPKSVDETTDTYDTVEWLLKNVPNNNGRAGALGVSYPGFLATMAGINPHPAMKAISPQAPMTDTWMGDDFFHQGAFRLSYGFEYAGSMELSNDQSVPLPIDRWDTYDWYLALGPLVQRQRQILSREGPDLECLRRAPCIRHALAKARGAAGAEGSGGAYADGGRLVGPGGPVRAAGHLRSARAR